MSVLQLDKKNMEAAAAAIVVRAEITDPAQIVRLCQTFNTVITDNLETFADRYREPAPTQSDLWVHGLTIGGVLEALQRPIISPRQVIKFLDCAIYNTTQATTHAIAESLIRCMVGPDQDLDHERRAAQNDPSLCWA